MAHQECPSCGWSLKVSIEHIKPVPSKPAIASPRWDCQNCGWSSSDEGGTSTPEKT